MKKITSILLLAFTLSAALSVSTMADPLKGKAKLEQMELQKVNLNTASMEQLLKLPGIGKKKAAAIIDYRSKNGKFKSIGDVVNVKGIGKKMLVKLKGQIKIS